MTMVRWLNTARRILDVIMPGSSSVVVQLHWLVAIVAHNHSTMSRTGIPQIGKFLSLKIFRRWPTTMKIRRTNIFQPLYVYCGKPSRLLLAGFGPNFCSTLGMQLKVWLVHKHPSCLGMQFNVLFTKGCVHLRKFIVSSAIVALAVSLSRHQNDRKLWWQRVRKS